MDDTYLHSSYHFCVIFCSLGPVAVPLDVPEDALPLPPHHLPPHLPHPHPLVPEAGPALHLLAGEVTGGGGEHVFRDLVHLGCKSLRVLRLELSNVWGADSTFFSWQVQFLSFTRPLPKAESSAEGACNSE